MTFLGKTVVITGASMGIGEAIAVAFAADGANLVLAARNEQLLQAVAERLSGAPGRVLIVPTDITRPADIQNLVQQALQVSGTVDVLVNNAGVGMNGAVESLDLTELQACLAVNLFGAISTIQAFLPAMKAAGGGTIVQVSSVLGKVSVPYTAGYNASKHALNAISDALRIEMAPHGIQVISVYPGSTETNFRDNSLGQVGAPKVRPRRVTAAKVGERILRAVRRGERDVYVTFSDALLCWAATRMGRLTDFILKRLYGAQR